jgi:salicylate hydroxylase
VQALIDNMDSNACYKWALFDRQPMPKWSEGRVTLLGDACHPTLPFMAQGAAMAIEDAAVLASCVAGANGVAEALARYESLRRSRTSRIQLGSRANAKLFHLRPPYSWARNQALGRARGNVMDWVYRYDALTAVQGNG